MEPTTTLESTIAVPEYAGFWDRFIAILADGFVVGFGLSALVIILNMIGEPLNLTMERESIEDALFHGVAGLIYYAWMESSHYQATVGKILVGLKVTDEQGARITFGNAVVRHFAKFLSAIILGIGYLMMLWSPKRQTLHDKIAKTLVIKIKKV